MTWRFWELPGKAPTVFFKHCSHLLHLLWSMIFQSFIQTYVVSWTVQRSHIYTKSSNLLRPCAGFKEAKKGLGCKGYRWQFPNVQGHKREIMLPSNAGGQKRDEGMEEKMKRRCNQDQACLLCQWSQGKAIMILVSLSWTLSSSRESIDIHANQNRSHCCILFPGGQECPKLQLHCPLPLQM